MNNRCPKCGTQVPPETWHSEAREYNLSSPWNAKYTIYDITCRHCKSDLRILVRSFSMQPFIWLHQDEHAWRRWEGTFVDGIRMRNRSRFTVMPLNVIWCWHPLMHDPHFQGIMWKLVQDYGNQPGHATVIILPPGVREFPTLPVVDEVFRLPEAAMQDLIEPYPSIMAEHFIKVGFGGAKLERVFHFWHSPLLSAAHYLPLAQDVDLVRGWTMLQKKNLKVQVKENK